MTPNASKVEGTLTGTEENRTGDAEDCSPQVVQKRASSLLQIRAT